jgi:hypothetical protein
MIPPTVNFGVGTGDPALAMFSTANFPAAAPRSETAPRPLRRVGRPHHGDQRNGASRCQHEPKCVYQGDSKAEGRLQEADVFIQDNWRMRSNLSLNVGIRCSSCRSTP